MMSRLAGSCVVVALLGAASGTFVEYNTYDNNDCVTVISSTVYTGVPAIAGVQATDMCLEYEESTTTTFVTTSLTNGDGIASLQHVCNTTEPGLLTTVWYSTDDCDQTAVSLEFAEDECRATCTEDEPDFGSDEFEDTTVTFYDSSDCTNATGTEVYTTTELYDLYGIEDGACSPSGDFDFYTILHCSNSAPATVFYEDDECTGDMVGITYNSGCAPVPTNGTYPGDYFMAECVEGDTTVADDDSEDDDAEDVDGTSGAAPCIGFGLGARSLVLGVVASAVVAATFDSISSLL